MHAIGLRHSVSAAAILAFALSAALPASTNRFFNPDFDADATGWGGSVLTPDAEDRDSCSDSGSAFFSGTLIFSSYIAAIQQCVPVAGGETLHASGDVRLLAATSSTDAAVGIQFSNSCSTAGGSISTPLVTLVLGAWTHKEIVPIVVPVGQTSAVITWAFQSAAAFDVLFDRAYASDFDRLLEEDFELGDTVCRWSGSLGFVP